MVVPRYSNNNHKWKGNQGIITSTRKYFQFQNILNLVLEDGIVKLNFLKYTLYAISAFNHSPESIVGCLGVNWNKPVSIVKS